MSILAVAGAGWFASREVSVSPSPAVEKSQDADGAERMLSERTRECLLFPFESEEQLSCYYEAAKDILAAFSFAVITEALAAFQAEEDAGPGVCHDIMHHISALHYERVGDFYQTFEQCPATCTFSCYHGVAMAHLALLVGGSELVGQFHLGHGATRGQRQLSEDLILETCDPFLGKMKSYDLFAVCANGVGHALPTFFGEDSVEEALSWCGVFDDEFARLRCEEGAFHKLAFSPAWLGSNPQQAFSLCRSVSSKYQETCYGTMVVILGNRFRDDAMGLVQACGAMPASYQRYCYRMLGISAPLNPYDPDALVARCATAPEGEAREQCVGGLIRAFANKYIPYDVGYVVYAAQDVCERAGEPYAEICYSELGRNLGEYTADVEEQRGLCAGLSFAEGREFCMQPSAF